MKANMKRIIGAGMLSLTMAANMSMAFAASDTDAKQDTTKTFALTASTAAAQVDVKTDPDTGKQMFSTDGGKTWQEAERILTSDDVTIMPVTSIAGEFTGMQELGKASYELGKASYDIKIDAETGDMLISCDGGKTWEKAEMMQATALVDAVQVDGAAAENEIVVTTKLVKAK